jgi:hypothetical protein
MTKHFYEASFVCANARALRKLALLTLVFGMGASSVFAGNGKTRGPIVAAKQTELPAHVNPTVRVVEDTTPSGKPVR